MVILDLNETRIKQQISSGSIIILKGETSQSFVILHSGMVEVLYQEEGSAGSSPEQIIRNSLRVGLIKGEALLGISLLLENELESSVSIRTVSECVISTRPMNKVEMMQRIQGDTPLNLKILRDLISRIESTFYIFNNYKYLWHKFASICDSIALGTHSQKPLDSHSQQKPSRNNASLIDYSAYLINLIKERDELELPVPWDHNLFLGKIQDSLDLYADHDNLKIEDLIDNRQFIFIKRLIEKKDEIVASLFERDEPTNQYIVDFLSLTTKAMVRANIKMAQDTNKLIDRLYSDKGWIKEFITANKTTTPQFLHFLHYLTVFSWRCRKDSLILLGKDIMREYKIFAYLKKYKNHALPAENEGSKARFNDQQIQKRLSKYKGLLGRILDFSNMPENFRTDFASIMDELLEEEKKTDTNERLQKLKDEISEKYWRLYEACFLKIIDSDLKGFVPGIMLHFGVVDERFLNDEELLMIDDFYARNLYSDDSIPAMTLPYFLEKIYKGEIQPSITEMGDGFQAVLKAQAKMTKKEKQNSTIFKDTPDERVRFELRKVAKDVSGMLSGKRKKTIPFLCSQTLGGNAARFFIEPERLVKTVEKYRKRDYSLFYREVLVKHELGSDFIKKESIPNFVLYPVVGARAMMWQEMEGTKKDSRGRLFFPLFHMEKLNESVLTQLAYYRWELQKNMAGYNWTDPVEGGLVGVYYDYIHFYKKNPNISLEAKKRLEEFIKKTKSDKDRFARDYATWVEKEYEGKVILNNFVREIYYRFCPFPEAVRAEMAQKPSNSAMENRFQNRRQKDMLKIKSKLIKFEKKKKKIPPALMRYIKFLEM